MSIHEANESRAGHLRLFLTFSCNEKWNAYVININVNFGPEC